MKKISMIAIAVSSLICSSCLVSRKKYEIAEAGRYAALYSRDSLADQLGMARGQINALCNDTMLLNSSLQNYKSLLANNQSENQKLAASLGQKMSELEEREQTIIQLQSMINEQKQKVNDLLNSVKEALLGFSTEDLSVREENGKVYVAMSDKLLFESGKAVVNEQGRQALGKLAQVLNEKPDIDVQIEGHTDNVPIRTPVYQDNWDLSVIRATSVVRILTETYKVNPLQILPSGCGEYKPVDLNTTAEGRARNRRTEIIMAPRLDKLFRMLQNS